MYIKNKYVSLIFKILIVSIGIYGLYDNCFKSIYVSLGEHFSYYTNLSNLLCVIYFIIEFIIVLLNLKKCKHHMRIKGSILIVITITGVVYNFILRPFMTDMDGVMDLNSIGNYIVHIIIPLMIIADYLLFDKKGLIKKKDLLYFPILPFIYFIFICIRAKIGKPFIYTNSNYPYFFLDIDAFGLIQVILNVTIIIICIFILGYIFLIIDKKLYKES